MKEIWRKDLPPLWSRAANNEWQSLFDEKTKNRIRRLIQSIYNDGLLCGLGKPEILKHRTEFSRRINHKDRLIYDLNSDKRLIILSIIGHYE